MRIKRLLAKTLLTGILTVASATVVYGAGWIQDGGYWWYQNEDSSYACNGSQFIDGRQNHFDENGHWTAEGSSQGNEADEALYKAYIAQKFDERNIQIALADLTHDGHDELVTVYSSGTSDPVVSIYTIEQNQVKEIFRHPCNFRVEFYLTIRDGAAYWVNKATGVYQGEGDMSYTVASMNPDGTKNVIEEYSVYVNYHVEDSSWKEKEFENKFENVKRGATVVIRDYISSLWSVSSVFK